MDSTEQKMREEAPAEPGGRGAGLAEILALLSGTDEIVGRLADGAPDISEEYRDRALMVVAGAFCEVFGSRVEAPDWIPYLPYYLPRLAPNPDTVNAYAAIDPHGSYLFEGVKGSEVIATITLRKGGPHLGERCGARTGEINLLTVETDAAGRFRLLMSPVRPDDVSVPWFPLHPGTTCLMLRRVLTGPHQQEGVCGIRRLDRPAPPAVLTTEERESKLGAVARYARAQSEFLLHYMNHLRKIGAEKGFVLDDQTDYGGLISQIYYFHLFDLAEDEVLLLESDAPQALYWSVNIIDRTSSSIDWVMHQSSLNNEQTRIDDDGRIRIVVSPTDPGLDNWLDTGGWQRAGLIWRWNEPSFIPRPTVIRLPAGDLLAHLGRHARWLSPSERMTNMAARTRYYQERRR